jgi:hypothetical protein
MYLKLRFEGALEDCVRAIWPESLDDDLLHDYENVYEWIWLRLPKHAIRLNISREHGFDDELDDVVPEQVGFVYISAFEIDREQFIDAVPEMVVQQLASKHEGRIEIFSGRCNVDVADGVAMRTIENGREQGAGDQAPAAVE